MGDGGSGPDSEQPVAADPASTEPAPEARGSRIGLNKLRWIGLAMFAYGAVMLALMFTPAKQWALDHSIAALVSAGDRRANNMVEGPVDEPMAYVGSAVVMFAGLWIGLFVPWLLNRNHARMVEQVQAARRADR